MKFTVCLSLLLTVSVAAADSQVLFSQPPMLGAEGNFFIRRKPAPGEFWLTQWQTNPYTGRDEGVPLTWAMEQFTGHVPRGPRELVQVGNVDRVGSSGAQADGDTFAVYVNSRNYDAADCQPRCKANLMAGHTFPTAIQAFEARGDALAVSVEAKVPTSTKVAPAASFVNIRLRFLDQVSEQMVSFGINLFSLDSRRDFDVIGQDPITKDVMFNSRFLPGMKFISLDPSSASAASRTFADFRKFKAFIPFEGFARAIAEAKAMDYGRELSSDPRSYLLIHTHIEPEVTQTSARAPASIGAAFRGFEISRLTDWSSPAPVPSSPTPAPTATPRPTPAPTATPKATSGGTPASRPPCSRTELALARLFGQAARCR